jgi:hypothetical protein
MTKQFSPRRKDFDSMVAMCENNAIELPYISEIDYEDVMTRQIDYRTLNGQPEKHLLLQMLTISDAGEGKAPVKGAGYTDDIFRALTLQTLIHNEKVMQRLQDADMVLGKEKRAMPVPGYAPRAF